MADIEPGDSFSIAYPFVRTSFTEYDDSGPYEVPSWKPGVRFEPVYPDDCEAFADGVGRAIFHVVSVHKPGRFPTRVFFTRSWIGPDGKCFGKGALRICTLEKFRRLTRGYAHPYEIATTTHTTKED